jgi:hypothetical protein
MIHRIALRGIGRAPAIGAERASGTTTSRRFTFCRQFIRAVFSCPT